MSVCYLTFFCGRKGRRSTLTSFDIVKSAASTAKQLLTRLCQ